MIKKFIMALFLLCFWGLSVSFGQEEEDPETPCPPDLPGCTGEDDPNAPLDGGISILLAAGALYGLKKLKDKRQTNQSEARVDIKSSNIIRRIDL